MKVAIQKGISMLLVIALAFAVAGCTSGGHKDPVPTQNPQKSALSKTLVISTIISPVSFDPMFSNDSCVERVCVLAYDSLLKYEPLTKKMLPSVAESWEISEDGMSITMKMRQGIKFHDGTEMTASDVKFSIERILKSQRGIVFELASVDHVDIIDDYRFKVVMNEPNSAIFDIMAKVYVINEDAVKAHEVNGDGASAYLAGHPLGSGPYKLTEFIPEQQAQFVRNDEYWGGWEENQAEQVVYKYVKESATQRLLLEKGDVDIILDPGVNNIAALKNTSGIKIDASETFCETYVHFRITHEPLDNPLVRKALAMAYDYGMHISIGLQGYGVQAKGPIAEGFPEHNGELQHTEFNLEKAKALLTEAGYPNGGFTLKVAYETEVPEKAAIIDIMIQCYSKLGITVEPMAMTWDAEFEMEGDEHSEPDMYVESFYCFSPSPESVLRDIYHSTSRGSCGNASWYSNPEVDKLLDDARKEMDAAKRKEIIQKVQKLIADDYPTIFISNVDYVVAMKDYISGYVYNPVRHETVNAYDIRLNGKP